MGRSILGAGLVALCFLIEVSNCFSQAKEPVGKFVAVEGKVFIIPEDRGQERLATVGTLVYLGDLLRTEVNAKAKLLMVDDSLITLGPETELSLKTYFLDHKAKERESMLGLIKGKVKVIVAKLLGYKSRYEVETKTAIAGVRGTSVIIWTEKDPYSGKITTWILVLEGELYVTAQGVTKILGAGMIIQVVEGEPPKDPREATEEEKEKAKEGTQLRLLPGALVGEPGFTLELPPIPGPPEVPPPSPGGQGPPTPEAKPLPPPPAPPR